MVEITAALKNKENEKKMRTVSETSGTALNVSTFNLQQAQKRNRKGLFEEL